MASTVSNQDFQRLQESLLELKTRNYTLEEEARKSKHVLAEATVKIRVLEESLGKANKAIEKSKKAQEVQHLIKERSFLQEKLSFQDEQFRLQNETLMQELTLLVRKNEELESQLTSKVASPLISDSSSRDDLHRLQMENHELRGNVAALERRCAEMTATISRTQPAGLNVDKKQDIGLRAEEENGQESRLRTEVAVLSTEAEALRVELASAAADKKQLRCIIEDIEQGMQQLRAENERQLEQLKEVNEQQLQKLKAEMAQQIVAKEQELTDLFQIKKQLERKAEELESGRNAARSRADQLAAELEIKMIEHASHLSLYPLEKFKELEAARICLENELTSVKEKAQTATETSVVLKADLDQAWERIATLEQQLEEARAAQSDLEAQHLSLKKISESRKNLIDEMASELQKKAEEHLATLDTAKQEEANLKLRLDELEQQLNEKMAEISRCGTNYAAISTKLDWAEESRRWQEAELRRKDEAYATAEDKHRREMTELRAHWEREREVASSEEAARLSDLTTQLELVNAQRVEFEEATERLRQELRDALEDKKIAEKKGRALLKDLTRQLQQEKKRNEKLQERMKDCLIDTYSNCSDPSKELDPERSSISSWSLMSGNNERERDLSTPSQISPTDSSLSGMEQSRRAVAKSMDSLPGPTAAVASTSAAAATAAVATVQQENEVLLGRLAAVQQEKWRLEERVQMVEQSAAAMADEICRKNELIQFYCMEARGRAGGGRVHQPQSPTSPPEKVRNFVNNLVNNDLADGYAKEMHRMQQMLEETLTKNMHLQQSLDQLSQEVVRLSKQLPVPSGPTRQQQMPQQ